MSVEYNPVFDLESSKAKLQYIAKSQVEIPEKTLFEGVLDVLASRGGDRWRQLIHLLLTTESGITVGIDHRDAGEEAEDFEFTSISTEEDDNTAHLYSVRVIDSDYYELVEVDLEADELNPVSNWGNLASARLYSILADAHASSPLEELSDERFFNNP